MLITFRRGTEADARAAADLWLCARKAAIGAIPKPVHDDDDVRAWFASHVVCDTELWVAEDRAGTLVGILVLDGHWLDQLYVEPTNTGRGIGAGLVKVAKRERPEGLQLWTFASNAGAQRFYERHGFVEARRTDGRDNEEGAPDILYVWRGEIVGAERTVLPREAATRHRRADDVARSLPSPGLGCDLGAAAPERGGQPHGPADD